MTLGMNFAPCSFISSSTVPIHPIAIALSVYGLDGCTWGAYPGESLDNVASGIGFVQNAFMVQDIEKSVLRSPFVHTGQLTLSEKGTIPLSTKQFRAVSALSLGPSVWNILKVVWHMMFSRPK